MSAEAVRVLSRTNYVITVKFSESEESSTSVAHSKDKRGAIRPLFERRETLLECPLREAHIRRRVGSEDLKNGCAEKCRLLTGLGVGFSVATTI
jgi:hypothetical protein